MNRGDLALKGPIKEVPRRMKTITEHVRDDILDLRSRINPDFEGDLTLQIVYAMLVIVRRLKTRLEVMAAELEKN